MFYETIDLYAHFGLPRSGRSGGYLTVYARADNPENTRKSRPAVLVIPGGAYCGISFRESEPVAMRFLAQGFSAFVLTYTVRTAHPVPLCEAAMAMAYIRQNAARYLVDANHVCAVGFSAGGHLAGVLATADPSRYLPAGWEEKRLRPDAVILAYAVSSMAEGVTERCTAETISGGDPVLRASLSNDAHVTKESAPAFIWHTVTDDVVPVENALRMAEAYRRAGVAFELHLFEEGLHGLSTADIEVASDPDSGNINEAAQQWLPLAFGWLARRGFTVRFDRQQR